MTMPRPSPTPEQELLGSLTIRRPAPIDRQREVTSGPLDADRLLAAARNEGVAGLLYANLKRAAALASLPPALRRDLEAAYHRTAAMNLRLQQDLRCIGNALAADGPAVVVFKGLALLETLYDDPGTRATGDIDLRVAIEDREALHRVLTAQGFCAEPFYPDTYRRGATTVDVHTHLLATARIRARAGILAAGEAPLLAACLPTPYGRRVERLEAAAELLLLTLHLMKHNADRLIWLIEINERVAGLDTPAWRRLLALFDAMRQRQALARTGFLARLLLPHTVAKRLREAAEQPPPGRVARRALQRRLSDNSLPAWGPLVFFSAPGWRTRAANVFETLLPRPRVLRQVFEDAETSTWRLYLRRIGQLVALVVHEEAARAGRALGVSRTRPSRRLPRRLLPKRLL